jgi:hypothetical protein
MNSSVFVMTAAGGRANDGVTRLASKFRDWSRYLYLKDRYGPVRTEVGWRIRNNDELEKLTWGEGMGKTKTVMKATEWNPIGMRSKGRPRNRWNDEVLNGLEKLKLKNWTFLVKNRKARYELEQASPAAARSKA